MVPPCSDRMSRVPPYSRTTRQMSRKGLSPVMPGFPACSAISTCGHWPDPRSLATTDGVSLMSFPRGTEMFQFPRFAFGTYGFSSKYLHGPSSIPALRPAVPCRTDGRGHGMAKVEGGFPHSEIRGSKPVRGSPRLIAAYHVLHRLSAPRHPPDTLMTLDHSHHRCPPGALTCAWAGTGHRRSASSRDEARSSSSKLNPRPLLPNMSEAGCGQASRHRALPCATRLTTERQQDRVGPRGSGRFGKLRLPRGPTLGSDTFTLHDVEQHAPAKARAMRRLDEPAANSCFCGRAFEPRCRGLRFVRPSPLPRRSRGGARRDRTDDLMLAKHALSQLSYGPGLERSDP